MDLFVYNFVTAAFVYIIVTFYLIVYNFCDYLVTPMPHWR